MIDDLALAHTHSTPEHRAMSYPHENFTVQNPEIGTESFTSTLHRSDLHRLPE